MAASPRPSIALVGGGTARPLVQRGARLRRRKSNAALIADFAALKKCLMLCKPCELRLPQQWMSRFGYRLVRDIHTSGRCDYCQDDTTCNIFHHELGGYVEEVDRLGAIEQSINQQQFAIRDKRRVH